MIVVADDHRSARLITHELWINTFNIYIVVHTLLIVLFTSLFFFLSLWSLRFHFMVIIFIHIYIVHWQFHSLILNAFLFFNIMISFGIRCRVPTSTLKLEKHCCAWL